MCSACPKVLPAANDREGDGGNRFHTVLWYSKFSLSWQQRDRENKKASITHFYKCQYFLEVSKGFCISAETLYHVSQSFVLVNIAQTGQLYRERVQGSPPATATTGHLPSQSKPDTKAIYWSCSRTRQASQPLFTNVQPGFIHGRQKRFERKRSEVLSYFLKEINTWRLVGNSTQNTCK